MFNIFRCPTSAMIPEAPRPPPAAERRQQIGSHFTLCTLHLLTIGGAGVEGAWHENLDWNSRGELPCDQPGRSVPRSAIPWTIVTSGEEIPRCVILACSGVRPILFSWSEKRRGSFPCAFQMSLTSLDRGACLQAISSYESPASRLLRKTVILLPWKAHGNKQVKNTKPLPDPIPDEIQFPSSPRPRIGFCP